MTIQLIAGGNYISNGMGRSFCVISFKVTLCVRVWKPELASPVHSREDAVQWWELGRGGICLVFWRGERSGGGGRDRGR